MHIAFAAPGRLRYLILLVLISMLVVAIAPADAQTLLRTLDTPQSAGLGLVRRGRSCGGRER